MRHIDFPATLIDRDGMQLLQPTSGAVRAAVARRIVILSRGLTYYTEEKLALTRHADIRAYLRTNAEHLCPFPGWQAVYLVESSRSGNGTTGAPRSRLKIWFYDPQRLVRQVGNGPALVLPEELLIAATSEQAALYQVPTDGPAFIVYAVGGYLRGSEVLPDSEQRGSQLLADFRALAGIEPQRLDDRQRLALLKKGLAAFQMRDLPGFFARHGSRQSLDGQAWRRLARPAGVLLGVWLLVSSAVVLYQGQSLRSEQQELSPALRQALSANNQEQQLIDRMDELLPLLTESLVVSHVLQLLGQLPLEDTRLSRLSLIDRQLLLAGETPSATALLAAVSSRPWVADARFSSPVSRQQQLDRFVLVITLDPAGLQPVAQVAEEGRHES